MHLLKKIVEEKGSFDIDPIWGVIIIFGTIIISFITFSFSRHLTASGLMGIGILIMFVGSMLTSLADSSTRLAKNDKHKLYWNTAFWAFVATTLGGYVTFVIFFFLAMGEFAQI